MLSATMSTMLSFSFTALLFAVTCFISLQGAAAAPTAGLRATITRIDSSLTLTERLQRALSRSHRRSQLLGLSKHPSDRRGAVRAPVTWVDHEYMISAYIGTPGLYINGILDTGSDLIWTQCGPCYACFPQPTPYYQPSNSTSFSNLPCSDSHCSAIRSGCIGKLCWFYYSYGDGTTTQGLLSTETFAFDGTPVAGLVFGCGVVAYDGTLSNSTGLFGMGRGPLSLPAQLQPPRFSYCLTPFESTKSSTLFLGSMAGGPSSHIGAVVQSTPFVPIPPSATASLYYIGLKAISIGGALLSISSSAFELKPDGSGGTIIDSGTFLTTLADKAYHVVRKKMVSAVHLPVAKLPEDEAAQGFDLCFKLKGAPPADLPEMEFYFEGGAKMVFPWDKYMYLDAKKGLLCSVVAATNGDMSILGNFQQQDMHIVYDHEANLLSFAPAKCEQS